MTTIYAVCWQDTTEPWGWEPTDLFFKRMDAEVCLIAAVQTSAEGWLARQPNMEPDKAFEWATQEHSIQEYEVQGQMKPVFCGNRHGDFCHRNEVAWMDGECVMPAGHHQSRHTDQYGHLYF